MPLTCRRLLLLLAFTPCALAQEPFHLSVHTNEVSITFIAEDQSGLPLTDLTIADVRLFDNNLAPDRVTLFLRHKELPLRIAILFDESGSMDGALRPSTIARGLAASTIQTPADQALIIRFDFASKLQQDWTSDPKILATAASHVADDNKSRCCGTALWDTLYLACRDHLSPQTPGAETSSNAIILFTDGLDNRSHALPQDVVEECQRKQTAIYPFVAPDRAHFDSGQKALRSIAELTGGRVFYQQSTSEAITASALQISQDLRNQYTLVYRPAKFKRNGAFHHIKLESPTRTAIFNARTGYYASR